MSISRRSLLKAGLGATALVAAPRPLLARFGPQPEPVPPIDDPRIKALALRALDAAQRAGATYADIRLTHSKQRSLAPRYVEDAERMAVGVRALVGGYWGFAASPVWSPEEMDRLAREAVHQARINTVGTPRVVDLAPTPVIADGHWSMPVQVDPFEVSPFEIQDLLGSLAMFVGRFPGAEASKNVCTFAVQEKAFASTEGSYCTQRTTTSSGEFTVALKQRGRSHGLALDCLTPAGLGWELYRAERLPLVRPHSLREAIRQLVAELEEDLALPEKPVDVGRYDTVFDAPTVSVLVGQTLGHPTELDRVMGFEANAGGTSFLQDPLTILGSFRIGAPLLTLTANRSDPGGAATVKWDDEGVSPDEFTLVTAGVLTDFQTTRESATWLADYYTRAGRPVRSHGCAHAPSAVHAPLHHLPNLVLAPGAEGRDFDALVAGMGQGIAVKRGKLDLDFQGASGLLTGQFYEVKNGRRVARLRGAGILFRTAELWRGLQALGGAPSARRYGAAAVKGEPRQAAYHSVTAVPAVVQQLTVIDRLRKA